MPVTMAILDGYTVEPSGLGVPRTCPPTCVMLTPPCVRLIRPPMFDI